MGTRNNSGLSDEQKKAAIRLFQDGEQTAEDAARPHGVDVNTIRRWAKQFKRLEQKTKNDDSLLDIAPPEFFNPDKPIEEYIDDICESYSRREKAHFQRKWMEFTVNMSGPIALVFIGDPHVDDNGCNWPLLKEHTEIIEKTEGMFSIPLGDYTNNWIGYLASKKYPDQEITHKRAWELAEWFLKRIKPLVIIKGNHDLWSASKGVKDPLDFISQGTVCEEWQARFQLKFPNNRIVKIHAAHNFKGDSIYNPNHGPMREELFSGSIADIYAAGDKHNWIISRYENARVNKCPVMFRARGYKYIDQYAEHLGYEPQRYGASVTCIIQPDKEGPTAISVWPELTEAKEYLNYLRSKYV